MHATIFSVFSVLRRPLHEVVSSRGTLVAVTLTDKGRSGPGFFPNDRIASGNLTMTVNLENSYIPRIRDHFTFVQNPVDNSFHWFALDK